LAHPLFQRVGRTIQQEADAERLQSIVKTRLQGDKIFRVCILKIKWNYWQAIPLFPVNYKRASSTLDYIITQLDNALFGLKIKIILFVLTLAC